MNRWLAVAAAWVLAGLVLGCGESGPALGTVTGQVTMDGKPLPNVTVTFIPIGEGGFASGITDAGGNYELVHLERKGAPIGKHKVAITTVQKSQTTTDLSQIPSDSPEYAKLIAESGGADYNVKFTEPIPAKYNAQTSLEQEVKSGTNVINLELKSM